MCCAVSFASVEHKKTSASLAMVRFKILHYRHPTTLSCSHAKMSAHNSALPVVPQGGLSQQGTVNWDNLVHRSLSFTIGTLSRCAAAGVDPFSVVVGQAVAQGFPLSHGGQQSVQTALNSLPLHNGYANAIWFGFGIKSFVRTLGMTDQGCSLLALCSALAECYHEEHAAEVMHNIVLSHNPPGGLTPSISQWLMIIRACAGVFSSTKFPVLAESFMRLDPLCRLLHTPIEMNTSSCSRGCPAPNDLADAIIGIGKVAVGRLESIAVTGCSAVGWIAAVGEWLFDLRVMIHDQQGNVLYSNFKPVQDAQLYVQFGSDDYGPGLEVKSKTYILKDFTEFIRAKTDPDDFSFSIVSGRVPWSSCLTSIFGSDFDVLTRAPINVGIAIGSAARVFKAVASAESRLPDTVLRDCSSYFSTSKGQGFVETLLRWFPELLPARVHMNTAVRFSFEKAKATYEEKLVALQNLCKCAACTEKEQEDEEIVEDGGENFCLQSMLETILVISQMLSGLTVADNLLPMRSGFDHFYRRQELARLEPPGEIDDSLGPISRILESTSYLAWNDAMSSNRRLFNGLRLFTGREARDSEFNISALSQGGICGYMDILRDFSLSTEVVGRVSILLGNIERDNKPFQCAKDISMNSFEQQYTGEKLDASLATLDQLTLTLTETPTYLGATFVLQNKTSKPESRAIRIGPAELVLAVSQARGLVHCPRSTSKCRNKHVNKYGVDRSKYPMIEVSLANQAVAICNASIEDDLLRAAALIVGGHQDLGYNCLWVDNQCAGCYLTEAFGAEKKPVLVLTNQQEREWLPRVEV